MKQNVLFSSVAYILSPSIGVCPADFPCTKNGGMWSQSGLLGLSPGPPFTSCVTFCKCLIFAEPWFPYPKKVESVVKPCHKAPTRVLCKQQHSWLSLLLTRFLSLSFLFCIVLSVSSLLRHLSGSISSPSLFSCFCLSPWDSLCLIICPWFLPAVFLALPGSAWNSSVLTKEETKNPGACSPASCRPRATLVVPTSWSKQGAKTVYREA